MSKSFCLEDHRPVLPVIFSKAYEIKKGIKQCLADLQPGCLLTETGSLRKDRPRKETQRN